MPEAIFQPADSGKQAAISYLLLSLLKARKSLHCLPQDKEYDEDVNVYLSQLLYDFSQPEYTIKNDRYLVSHESDLVQRVEEAADISEQYFVFKVNGDNLLIHLSIFRDRGASFRDQHRFWGRSPASFAQDAGSFYGQAARWNERIYHKPTAMRDVLLKLSHNISKYVLILKRVSQDYFDFFKLNFSKEVERMEVKAMKDQLLDYLHKWFQTHDDSFKLKVNECVRKICQKDPHFQFSWPE